MPKSNIARHKSECITPSGGDTFFTSNCYVNASTIAECTKKLAKVSDVKITSLTGDNLECYNRLSEIINSWGQDSGAADIEKIVSDNFPMSGKYPPGTVGAALSVCAGVGDIPAQCMASCGTSLFKPKDKCESSVYEVKDGKLILIGNSNSGRAILFMDTEKLSVNVVNELKNNGIYKVRRVVYINGTFQILDQDYIEVNVTVLCEGTINWGFWWGWGGSILLLILIVVIIIAIVALATSGSKKKKVEG